MPRQRGNARDGPEERKLSGFASYDKPHCYLIMDRAYDGDKPPHPAINRGDIPVVLSNRNRKSPRESDSKGLYE